MKVLKGVAYFFLSVFVVYIILCFLGPAKFETSKSIHIEASPSVVFDYAANFRTWPEWDAWSGSDPDIEYVYENPVGIGHKSSWSSAKVGSGSQEIVDFRQNEYIKSALRFTDWDGVSHAEFHFEADGNGTNVTWVMDGSELPFLARGVLLILGAQKAIESDYETGLAAMKRNLEDGAGISISIEKLEAEALYVIGKRQMVNPDLMDEEWYDAVMQEVAEAIMASGRAITGAPLAIIHNYSDDEMDVEVAFPVSEPASVPQGFTMTTVAAGPVLRTVYEGPYEEMGEAWRQMERYVALNNISLRGAPYEQYVVNPGDTEDPNEYVSHIIYPVK